MPTYDYRCNSCGHEFETFQGIKEEPLTLCPICNSKIHRMINGGATVIFKGSGFYVNDYRKSDNGNGNGKHKSVPKPDKPDKPESKTPPPDKPGEKSD